MIDLSAIEVKYRALSRKLDEASLRMWAAVEARSLGRGRINVVWEGDVAVTNDDPCGSCGIEGRRGSGRRGEGRRSFAHTSGGRRTEEADGKRCRVA
jgi:hypothetical protein